ncbi:hypothetical protein [Furfurilactobacillus siliginis]|uniref:Uncharacterized protein n=1 Tax=Furfurilactobacillus siliginis TaxID=348151 RepID=A0A0R2L551_9LACO|nr:hypothetical protein [Furfurilactobacillus siliginis]KRN96480.1 hypothetical protein IV55_GL001453 [Furfurilactobacillus siliginis]GEK29423.1 hypothetical protein LSI01_17340 [Furfurilactobacillus siliginis]
MKRKGLWALLGIVILGGAITAGMFFKENHDHAKRFTYTNLHVKKWQADTKPLITQAEFDQNIRKVNQDNSGKTKLKNWDSVVIPGLRGAWSINHQTKKPTLGKDWVPQGLTQNQDYYFISAYDGDHRLNSLIFVVNKHTGKYVKTLLLNNKSHVGGLAYDQHHQRLWISEDSSKYAGLAAVSQKEIDDYHAEQVKGPISTKKFNLPWAARTSGLDFYNNQLVIVKYGQDKQSRAIIAMPVQEDGYPVKVTDEILGKAYSSNVDHFIDGLVKQHVINSFAPGYDRMQGLTTTEHGLTMFSQSNGDKNAKILVKEPNKRSGRDFNFFAPAGGVTGFHVPPSVEQISINNPDDNQLAMLFESGAAKYRKERESKFGPYPMISDRLLILPIVESETK